MSSARLFNPMQLQPTFSMRAVNTLPLKHDDFRYLSIAPWHTSPAMSESDRVSLARRTRGA